ncbi:P-loop containing nucleoside triphosphate hydrolase protein [Cytidiella melzeri]|nr:P-loop containing nucleoside triphosphate hydrolase protein [Cytidiella melzeri]
MSEETSVVNGNTHFHPIFVVVMGVASTGKSTIAKALDEKLSLPYIEGDDLHPKANIDKMAQGIPLTDSDREPWLELIRTTAENIVAEQEAMAMGQGEGEEEAEVEPRTMARYGVMATCSSLKRYYRDILRGTYNSFPNMPEHLHATSSDKLPTYFVYIKAEEQLLRDRMAKREGHFMKSSMLDSQLATLESPEGEKNVVVIPLDATTEEQVQIAIEGLERLIGDLHLVPKESQGESQKLEVRGEHIL